MKKCCLFVKVFTLLLFFLFPIQLLSGEVYSQVIESKQSAGENFYESPYHIKFNFTTSDLMEDIISGTRGVISDESEISFGHWDSAYVRTRYGAWGPPARLYPVPEIAIGKSEEWKRERLLSVALKFRGYPYQHHHIPDWEPPEDWPWKSVEEGRNTKGIDCSNFTAFVYNIGLGIHLNSNIRKQAEQLKIPSGNDNEFIYAERIEIPEYYNECIKIFKTGDLLFIKAGGRVSHVIMWVGQAEYSHDGVPLIIDSTGTNHKDSNGVKIPNGVQLRPFASDSWYFKSLSHGTRIIK